MPNEEGALSAEASMATLTQYLWSIIFMPNSMKVLCLTNLFCWMSLVCYSLYFTDFVGEAVFKGNPVVSEMPISVMLLPKWFKSRSLTTTHLLPKLSFK